MGCSNCGSGTINGNKPAGCKNNGNCGTTGCNKLNTYDWLSHIERPVNYKPFNIVEIRFKGGRKEYFKNSNNIKLSVGTLVVVDAETGYDAGEVLLTDELVRLQLNKRGITSEQVDKKIQRICNESDLEKYYKAKEKEASTLTRARTIALEMGLSMKLSDIDFQGDNRKVTFYYTAETRVDFRELIKVYAEEFKVKIEMRQIGFRNEAARLGGIGSCGRELCCSTWLSDFKQVSLNAARTQNLSINMLKLSGVCGKLKCCLNFELDTYMDALKHFPKTKNLTLVAENGEAHLQKIDILKSLMWFQVGEDSNWVPLRTDIVKQYMKLNESGQKAPILNAPKTENSSTPTAIREKTDFMSSDDLLSSDLVGLDKKTKQSQGNKNNKKHKHKKQKRDN
ncbi:MAG: Signal peptidase-like protein [Bacteroidetes bacterium]|nr:Signal peptidase-like protein [Bacteroidota bacterium]